MRLLVILAVVVLVAVLVVVFGVDIIGDKKKIKKFKKVVKIACFIISLVI